MTERKVSVRLGIVGGKEVEAQFEQLGTRGANAMKRLGDQSEQAFNKVRVASQGGAGGLQNMGYQVQDFAVQVGAGTSATQALAQQLPQLLSGFGLVGILAGTAAAILIPLGAAIFNMGEEAEAAEKKIDRLVDAIGQVDRANQVYSLAGIQELVEKYGEASAAVLLMIERQQTLAENTAMNAASDVVASLSGGVDGMVGSLREYDSILTMIDRNNYGDVQAQKQQALLELTESLNSEYGLTVQQARDMTAAFDDLRAAGTVEEMANAMSVLIGLLEDSSMAGGELEISLLAAEDALRQLNAQGSGVNSWLDAAIGGAYAFATNLWDAAKAAASARAAAAPAPGRGDPRSFVKDEYWSNTYFPRPEVMRPKKSGAGRGAVGAGAKGGAGSATNELEKEAARIFEATRTSVEKYAVELAKLDQLKAAGLVSGDTYNRQMDALAVKYKQQGDLLAGLQTKLTEYAAASKNMAEGIGDSLVGAFDSGADAVANFVKTGKLDFSSMITDFLADLARLAAQKFIFGPLANMIGGGLGTKASVLHDGGIVGSSGRSAAFNPALFVGAPRFHSGVNLGLAADEVPAILQRGERVLSRSQNAKYGASGSQGDMNISVTVDGARGDAHIEALVRKGVAIGIERSNKALPDTLAAMKPRWR